MPATYEPIATTTLGTAAPSITFSSIPATYTDLKIIMLGTQSYPSGGNYFMQFNGSTTSLYSSNVLSGNSGMPPTVSDFSQTNSTEIYMGYQPDTASLSSADINIFSYRNTSIHKTVLVTNAADRNQVGSSSVRKICGMWRNTAAITSVTLFAYSGYNFNAGFIATLYGIKAA